METVKVLAKGQIVIPASIRKKYGIKPGFEMNIFEFENVICLVPPTSDPVKEAMGCLPRKPSLSEQLLEERRKDSAKALKDIKAGEEIAVTRRGKPVAKITALGPKKVIDWPDFFNEAIELKDKPASEIVIEGREDRF